MSATLKKQSMDHGLMKKNEVPLVRRRASQNSVPLLLLRHFGRLAGKFLAFDLRNPGAMDASPCGRPFFLKSSCPR